MASYKIEYAASSAVTITLASLGTSSTLVAGRGSDAIDNSSNKYLDYLLAGKITTGTSPTNDTRIQVCVVGILDDSTWPNVFDGTDSAKTVTMVKIKNVICKIVADMTIDGTSNQGYPFGPVSVAKAFDGVMPKKFVVFVTHNTVAALHATGGNHTLFITPVYATVT